mmetsp:Transcript_15592/g.40328  ORF Transcript_15592/g.40328 Transcript_15592/m.40328 type:complete len:109 (+) Transcript_15592:1039-1365(+)
MERSNIFHDPAIWWPSAPLAFSPAPETCSLLNLKARTLVPTGGGIHLSLSALVRCLLFEVGSIVVGLNEVCAGTASLKYLLASLQHCAAPDAGGVEEWAGYVMLVGTF